MLNQTLNTTAPPIASASQNIFNYFNTLPQAMSQGNVIAIIIALVVLFVLIVLINAISSLLLSFFKKTIIFIIILLIIYDFFPRYLEYMARTGWTFSNIAIGVIGVLASVIGFYIASRSFVISAKQHIMRLSDRIKNKHEKKTLEKKEAEIVAEMRQQHTQNIKQVFSKESIQNEKSLLAILVYLVVAEFGVFSSPTLSAPNTQVGLMFFGIFVVGILIFAKSSYKTFKIAALYFGVTFIVGLSLSLVLGVLWGKNTLAELLSLNFFTSDSLVAMITGMGVSLFAGSKG